MITDSLWTGAQVHKMIADSLWTGAQVHKMITDRLVDRCTGAQGDDNTQLVDRCTRR